MKMSFTGDFNWTTFVLVLIVCLVGYLYLFSRRLRIPPLPPSPSYRLPVLGHLLQIEADMRKPFRTFRKQFGDLYSLYLGETLVIVIGGYGTIKEALYNNGEAFSNRPTSFVMETMTRGLGLVSTNGPLWRDHRRFTMTAFKELGRNVFENLVLQEVTAFHDMIEHKKALPFDPEDIISAGVGNIICTLLVGDKYKQGDAKYRRLKSIIDENLSYGAFHGLMQIFPFLSKLPGDYFKLKTMTRNSDEFHKCARAIIDEHLNDFDEDKIEDFTSAYIMEMKTMERTNQTTNFSYDQLIQVIGELIIAGVESTTSSLRWSIACLINYPETQERMFTEIAEHIETTRAPSVRDRPNLKYTQAFLMEIFRFCNISGAFHATTHDLEFKGYTIPKDAMIMVDIGSVLEDEQIWGDPENFRPDRFLDVDGKLQKPEELIPFSIGKRNCFGESLAKTELFLFLTSLVQKFRLECPVGEDLSMDAIDGKFGLVHAPKPFRIITRAR